MSRIYVPAQSVDDWKGLLADPELHWKRGRSAYLLASAWQEADGFPASVRRALDDAGLALEMLVGLPEHRVPLPGGSRPSQTDLFILARDAADGSLAAIAIEGKVTEAFGPRVDEWRKDDRGGKTERLGFLLTTLGLTVERLPDDLRYQLLHRTASAVIEAQRFNAARAMMIVHSFDTEKTGGEDYTRFATLLGAVPEPDRITRARNLGTIELWLGWVTEDQSVNSEPMPLAVAEGGGGTDR